MRTLFLALQQYLIRHPAMIAAIKAAKGTDAPLYIRLWNDDVEQILAAQSEHETIDYPCIFIEFPKEIEYKQLSMGVQTADPLDISFHILYWEEDSGRGDMEQNLDVLDLAQVLYAVLQDYMPDTFTISADDPLYKKYAGTYQVPLGAMVRKRDEQDTNHPGLYHFIQTYRTSWMDIQQMIPVGGSQSIAPLPIEIEVNPQILTDQNGNKLTDQNGNWLLGAQPKEILIDP